MYKNYTALAAHSNWSQENTLSAAKLDKRLRRLASEKGSLTAALVAISNQNFEVKVIRQGMALPYFHEQQKLARALSRAAMVREVELQLYGESVVFARSIIPLALVTKGRNGLANLGRTPLGHLLFKDGKIQICKRDFTQIAYHSDIVSARRTPYDYQGSQILVSEFFLPPIYKHL